MGYKSVWIVFVSLHVVLVLGCCAQTRNQQPPPSSFMSEESVKKFLQEYVKSNGLNDNTQYFDSFVDLNGDGKEEVIVYMMGRWWCGSGGCQMLILATKASSYTVITSTTITRPPIRVLESTSNGWHSLGVWVQGGGIQPGYEAILAFDGNTYPRNPTVLPARRLTTPIKGQIAVPASVFDNGKSLYP